jgi:hypothetical protein
MERAPSMQDAEVDWAAVDPAAETSMRMALQLGAQLESAAALEERMENETAAALRVLRDYDDAARREEAEEDGDGMEAMGSMEHTLSETPEWDLNTILRRRTRRPDAPGTARLSDLDAEYDVADVRLEYLCFWVGRKGTAAQDQTLTSWESRLWLRDEGYSKQIDEVDRKAAPTRYHRPPPACIFESLEPYAVNLAVKIASPNIRDDWRPALDFLGPHCGFRRVTTTGLSPDVVTLASFFARILELAVKDALIVTSIRFVVAKTLPPFIEAVKARPKDLAGKLLFHGTMSRAVASICRDGLRVPGTHGVTVVHGSAYGVGIYAALRPGVSFAYSEQGDMFVCMARGSTTCSTKEFVVYGSDTQITPVLHIVVKRSGEWQQNIRLDLSRGIL